MKLILGIDGGGTKTDVCLCDFQGNEIGRGNGGSGNLATCNDDSLASSLHDALKKICQNAGILREELHCAAVCAGMAGYSLPNRRTAFLEILRREVSAETYRLEPDYVTAYWGATHGEPGIVLIAGTGSVAYGRNAAGEARKLGGRGYLLGEAGSGYEVGRAALQHTLARLEENVSDMLTESVLAHTDTNSAETLLQWLYTDFTPAKVAALVPLVAELVETSEDAQTILSNSACDSCHAARNLCYHLSLQGEVPVYLLGGLWKSTPYLQRAFEKCKAKEEWVSRNFEACDFTIRPPLNDAAYGAALLAREGEESAPLYPPTPFSLILGKRGNVSASSPSKGED